MTVEQINEYADVHELPDEARAALLAGTEWDGTPDDVEGASTWYFTNDDGEWYSMWYPSGYAVEGGKAYLRYMSVDSDGNWEFNDEAELGTPDQARLEKEFGYEAWKRNYDDYLRWVADNGDDPMDEFFGVKPTISAEQSWRAQYNDSILGLQLIQVKRKYGQWMRPEDAPSEITQFCAAHNRRHAWLVSDFKNLAEITKVVREGGEYSLHRAANRQGVVVGFTIKISRPNPHYARDLKRMARKALKPVANVIDDAEENPRWEAIR